jgi:DNA-binding NarL/FixJ family response regulator
METTILLADDHRIVREGLRKILETREDFSIVGEAADGEEAVRLSTEKHPDVVVMDIWMPRLSGIDAIRRILKSRNGTRCIALSMHQGRNYVEEALRAGASGYVVKSSAGEDLISAIDAVRSGRSYLSSAVAQQVVEAITHPDEPGGSNVAALTGREREVLQLIAEGYSSKEIAQMLGVSLKTVESHRANLMDKLNIHKVSSLVRFAIRSGLVAP